MHGDLHPVDHSPHLGETPGHHGVEQSTGQYCGSSGSLAGSSKLLNRFWYLFNQRFESVHVLIVCFMNPGYAFEFFQRNLDYVSSPDTLRFIKLYLNFHAPFKNINYAPREGQIFLLRIGSSDHLNSQDICEVAKIRI